jgi:hypothetical protein
VGKNGISPLTQAVVVRRYGERVGVEFRYESEMTRLAADACPWWWLGSRRHDFVAAEIVGPDAIADLVGIRFDQGRLRMRDAEGIRPVTDALALRALQLCRGRVLATRAIADACHVTPSGVRRALALAVEANAMIRHARGRYGSHPAWGPVGARLVAVELKLDNWRAAFHQAHAYACWANATWVVLARTPPGQAKLEAERDGLGLAVLRTDGKIERLTRPRSVRRPRSGWAALWASEQAIARAISAGYRADSGDSTALTAARATAANAAAVNLQSA